MRLIDLNNNVLTLKVKKSPNFILISFLFLSFLAILFPIAAIFFYIYSGNSFQVGFIFTFVTCSLISLYLFRLFFWNSRGTETLTFDSKTIQYKTNDINIFKEKIKFQLDIDSCKLSIRGVGYEKDRIGTLVLEDNDNQLITSVKIPIQQLEELIDELVSEFNFKAEKNAHYL